MSAFIYSRSNLTVAPLRQGNNHNHYNRAHASIFLPIHGNRLNCSHQILARQLLLIYSTGSNMAKRRSSFAASNKALNGYTFSYLIFIPGVDIYRLQTKPTNSAVITAFYDI